MLLLGMKSDLRDRAHHSGAPEANEGTQVDKEKGYVVSEERARRMAQALGAQGYLECSAKQDVDSVHKLFKVIAMLSISYMGCTKSDQTDFPEYPQYGRSTSAWKNLLSMSVIYH